MKNIIKHDFAILILSISIIIILLIAGLIFNFTTLKNKEIGFVKGKYSSVFEYNIPISLVHDDDKKIVNWLKKNNITPKDFIIASIKSNRYIPSNLDMGQDHFLNAFFFNYSHKDGFTKISLDEYLNWILRNKPRFIIWDIDFQESEYAIFIDNITKERKIAFNYNEFDNKISCYYQIKDTITRRIIVYEQK